MAEQITRRDFIKVSAAAAALPVAACVARPFAVRSPYASAIPDRDERPPRQRRPLAAQRHARRRASSSRRRVDEVRARDRRVRDRRASRCRSPAAATRWAASSSARPACCRHARPEPRLGVRRGARHDHGRRRHPVAAAASSISIACRSGSRRSSMGDLSEADRRRSPEHRRRACRATRTAAV